jgi:DNA-binding PadR family transcriptional regulator
MSGKRHIVCLYNKNTKEIKKMPNLQKQIQTKLTKGLLDLIVLQLIKNQSMHGYQIITNIRKSFGVYFGPSTIYPLLSQMEKKGHLTSAWNMNTDRPRKIYTITNEGKNMLNFTENSLRMMTNKLGSKNKQTDHIEMKTITPRSLGRTLSSMVSR